MQYFKYLGILLTLATLTSVLCLVAVSVGKLYPIWVLILFPFGILGVLMIADYLMRNQNRERLTIF